MPIGLTLATAVVATAKAVEERLRKSRLGE